MSVMLKSGALAAALVLAAVSIPSSAYAKCVMAGGEGSNLLPDVAKFMANAALNNSLAAHGLKAKGKIKQTCKSDAVLTTCVSKQRACK